MTEYVTVTVYVPPEHLDAVRQAKCSAGAGTVDGGRYDCVTYVSSAQCRYRQVEPSPDPSQTQHRELLREELRIEAICRQDRVSDVVAAICRAHPYDTPAIAIYPTLTGEHRYWNGQ